MCDISFGDGFVGTTKALNTDILLILIMIGFKPMVCRENNKLVWNLLD